MCCWLLVIGLLFAHRLDVTLEEGQVALRAGELDRAVAVFTELTQRDQDDAQAWLHLGTALHASGEYARAVEALKHAAEFESVRVSASYQAARAQARLGDKERAFAWLVKAVEAGYQDLRAMLSDPELRSISRDPRMQALLPIGEPARFVGDIEVLRTHRAESVADRFGWMARNAGDTDGDGVADLLVSAPYKKLGTARNAGRVYVYSGQSGKLILQRDGKAGDRLGIGIESAGDVDGDGHSDVMAGASGEGGTGAVHVWSGKTGEELHTLRGEGPGDQFGRKVAGTGDLNGDGHDDLVVGAPFHDGAGQDAGRVTVYSGDSGEPLFVFDGERAGDQLGSCVDGHTGPNGTLLILGEQNAGESRRGRVRVMRISNGQAELSFRIESREGDMNLGRMFVSAVGDVNGDGFMDVYASDWESSPEGITGAGRVYIHSGSDGSTLHVLQGTQAGEGFGIGTAEAGDQNGDGCDDLLIGSWLSSEGAPSAGKCTLFSGKSGEVLRTIICRTPGETFGYDATRLDDMNGDGVPELLITAAESLVGGWGAGRVFVIAGGVD